MYKTLSNKEKIMEKIHNNEPNINNNKDKKLMIAYLELIITAFLWGLATILIKDNLDKIPTFHVMASRFLIGAIFVFVTAPKKILSIEKNDIKQGVPIGIVVFLTYALFTVGLKYTSASKAGFLVSLSVLFVPAVQSVLNKKKPSKWTIISISLSIIGLYLISGMNGTSLNMGDIIIMTAAVGNTLYIISIDRLGKNVDNYRLSFIQLFTTFIISLAIAMFYEGINFQVIKDNTLRLLLIGICGTGITTFLQTKSQKIASPESVGIILLGEPLTTLLLAFFFLNETILLRGFVGSIILTIALIIAILKKI